MKFRKRERTNENTEILEASGTIGFVAPAFGCNMEPYRSGFDAAQKTFAALGHTMILGPNCYEGSGIGISNTPPKVERRSIHFLQSRK